MYQSYRRKLLYAIIDVIRQELNHVLVIFHKARRRHLCLNPFHPIHHFGSYLHNIHLPYLSVGTQLLLSHQISTNCSIFELLPSNDQLMARQNVQWYLSISICNNFYHDHAELTLRISFFPLHYPSNSSCTPSPKIILVRYPIWCKAKSSTLVGIIIECES